MKKETPTEIKEYNKNAIKKINCLIEKIDQTDEKTPITVTLKFNNFWSLGFALEGIFTAIETIIENDNLPKTGSAITELAQLGKGIAENIPFEFLNELLLKNYTPNPDFEPIEKLIIKN